MQLSVDVFILMYILHHWRPDRNKKEALAFSIKYSKYSTVSTVQYNIAPFKW